LPFQTLLEIIRRDEARCDKVFAQRFFRRALFLFE
jgi:hypothetical protein